jgi:hypothetical protein
MPITINPGMTGAEMMDEVVDATSLDTANIATDSARVLRRLNLAQSIMFNAGDWEDLRVNNTTITSTGAGSYNLKTLISDFGRIKDHSVRCGTKYLVPVTKDLIDEKDPDGSRSGTPQEYAVSGTELFTYPKASSGLVITLDYIKMPTQIASGTAAADISFFPEHHTYIVDGAISLTQNRQKRADWKIAIDDFRKAMKREATRSTKYRAKPKQITRREF